MTAGLASVTENEPCALILKILCRTAPEMSDLSIIPRKNLRGREGDEVCIMQTNHGRTGCRIRSAPPRITIKNIVLSLSILRVDTQHTP